MSQQQNYIHLQNIDKNISSLLCKDSYIYSNPYKQNKITTKLIWQRGFQDRSYRPQTLFAGKALSVTDNIPTMCINNDIQAVHFSLLLERTAVK
jgi:hypothetical protein